MSYESFKSRVSAMMKRAGIANVRFSNDNSKGKFFANFPDGTTIIGNSACKRVEVRWGSGHKAMAAI